VFLRKRLTRDKQERGEKKLVEGKRSGMRADEAINDGSLGGGENQSE
jgi:hypothetical protein